MALQCNDHNERRLFNRWNGVDAVSGRRGRYVRSGGDHAGSVPAHVHAEFAKSVAKGENSGRWQEPAGWTKPTATCKYGK